ncbi:hypothetical protein ACFYUL_14175 [Streptomyces sp. NPDC004311]|uniref:hypothetical protein n=1 Tax=Streptomyces sp. NPDC004311 TaxID=3364698 RepID=UPI00367C0240
MRYVVRGTAVAAVLVLALTGCQEDPKPSGGQAPITSVPGAIGQEPVPSKSPEVQDARLDAAALMQALPDESDVSKYFSGGEPFAVGGPEAVKHCAKETGTACTGLIAVGGKDTEGRGSNGTRAEFRLFSFETAEQARTVMKGLADERRKVAARYKDPSKPVTLVSGADETDAFMDDAVGNAVMRVGTVVAHVNISETELEFLAHVAGLQVDRVRAVAAGRDPRA